MLTKRGAFQITMEAWKDGEELALSLIEQMDDRQRIWVQTVENKIRAAAARGSLSLGFVLTEVFGDYWGNDPATRKLIKDHRAIWMALGYKVESSCSSYWGLEQWTISWGKRE